MLCIPWHGICFCFPCGEAWACQTFPPVSLTAGWRGQAGWLRAGCQLWAALTALAKVLPCHSSCQCHLSSSNMLSALLLNIEVGYWSIPTNVVPKLYIYINVFINRLCLFILVLVCFPAGPQGSKSIECDTWMQKYNSTGFSSCFFFLYIV